MPFSAVHPRNLLLATLLAVGFAAPKGAAAVIIRHDKADALYTDLAANAKYVSVGRLQFTDASGAAFASAVYIGAGTDGKKWLISAAHVLKTGLTSASFTIGGTAYTVDVATIAVNPNDDLGKGDIGVAQILDPTNTLTVAPAVFSNMTFPIAADLATRTVATCVGYGDTGNGNDGESGNDGKKRAFQNVIDCLGVTYHGGDRNLFGYVSDFDDSTAAKNTLDSTDFPDAGFPAAQKSSRPWLDLEGLGADGDSGGGLFADIGTSNLLIGIESGNKRIGDTVLDRYGAYTICTPMDQAMAEKVRVWTGIQGVPEPCTWIGLFAGATAILRRRRPSRSFRPRP